MCDCCSLTFYYDLRIWKNWKCPLRLSHLYRLLALFSPLYFFVPASFFSCKLILQTALCAGLFFTIVWTQFSRLLQKTFLVYLFMISKIFEKLNHCDQYKKNVFYSNFLINSRSGTILTFALSKRLHPENV